MNESSIKISNSSAVVYSLMVFTYIIVNLFQATILELPSRFALLLSTIILTLMILKKNNHLGLKKNQIKLLLPFVFLNIAYLLNTSLSDLNLNNVLVIIYQFFFIMLIFNISNIVWSLNQIRILTVLSVIPIIILALQLLLDMDILNSNSIGAFTYFLSFIPALYILGFSDKRNNNIKIITFYALVLTIVWLSDTRSIMICVLIGFITCLFWKYITKNKIVFYSYFIMHLVGGYIFTVIYPNIDKLLKNFNYYNQLVYENTGKNLYSGREVIWKATIEKINEKILFGHGSFVQVIDFLHVDLSTHNLYLNIALQVGIIGLFLFMLFFLNIWKSIWNNRDDIKTKIFASYFLGIIIYQLFELSLLRNHLALSIIQWLIVGIGLSTIYNKSHYKKDFN